MIVPSFRYLGTHRQKLALCCRLNSTNALTAEYMLCDENKEHVLNCMQKDPPVGMRRNESHADRAYAAVLIALCTPKSTEVKKEVSILYTRRSLLLSRHVRQVSFPGGLHDHTDNDYIDCALRETEEEIGLPRSRVEIWGTGCHLTPPNTATIVPVIGRIRDFDIAELVLNEDEVEDAFTVDIKDLISPEALRYTQFKGGFSSPHFAVKPYPIWGVTAFITNTFLHCLLPSNVFRNRLKFIKPYKTEKPMFKNINE